MVVQFLLIFQSFLSLVEALGFCRGDIQVCVFIDNDIVQPVPLDESVFGDAVIEILVVDVPEGAVRKFQRRNLDFPDAHPGRFLDDFDPYCIRFLHAVQDHGGSGYGVDAEAQGSGQQDVLGYLSGTCGRYFVQAENRDKAHENHADGTEGGASGEGRGSNHHEIVEKGKEKEKACIAYRGTEKEEIREGNGLLQEHAVFFVKAKSLANRKENQEHSQPVDGHFLETGHDIIKMRYGFFIGQPDWREHGKDTGIADRMGDKGTVEIGNDQENDQQKQNDFRPISLHSGRDEPDASLFQEVGLQDAIGKVQEQYHRQDVEDHFPVSRELIPNMLQEGGALVIIADIVARSGKQHEKAGNRSQGARDHPGTQLTVPMAQVKDSDGQHAGGHSEVFDGASCHDAEDQHDRYHIPSVMLPPSGEVEIVRKKEEKGRYGSPKINGGAAHPDRCFPKMRQTEPCQEPGSRKEDGFSIQGKGPPAVQEDEQDEGSEHGRIEDIKPACPQQQEKIQPEDADHASSMLHIVMEKGSEDIAEGCHELPGSPDHGIVIVVPMEGHHGIQGIKDGEDDDKHQKGRQDSFCTFIHSFPPRFCSLCGNSFPRA